MLHYNTQPGNRAVVIYHDNCMDGFASAWAFYRLAAWRYKEVKYIPCNYGKGLPEIELTDVWPDVFIVDFSFSRKQLSQLALTSNTLTVLDHHKTAAEDLADWTNYLPANCTVVFDMSRSGAGISWDFFKQWKLQEGAALDFRNSRAGLISYVEDRDLWRFKLPDSKAVNAYIALADHTFDAYDELYGEIINEYDKVVEIGEALNKQHLKIAKQLAAHSALNLYPAYPSNSVIVNCPPQFASEVGNILASTHTCATMWWVDERGTNHFSLRSQGDKCDVSVIAKFFGGGGHKNAAGYKIEH